MSSPAFSSLAMFLTRPLVLHYPLTAVLNAQLVLEANLSRVTLPFTFTLSAELSAPQPFADTGIPWTQWATIFGDQPLHFSVTEQCVKLSIGQLPFFVLWAQSVEESSYVPFISKSKRTASDVQAPRIFSAVKSIKMPSLSCIDSPVDLDSDTESDSASSSFSFSSSSSDSMTSVSSRSSSPSSKDSTPLPPSKDSVALPYSVPITPRYLPRKQPHAVINRTKSDPTRYLYKGGSTNVMTGGVMLGKATPAKADKPRRKTVLLGPESHDWRRRD